MKIYEFRQETTVNAPLEVVFPFFAEARNLERITPAFLSFNVLTPEPIDMAPGTVIDYKLRVHHVPILWRTVIESWNPPHEFSDRQIRGPYLLWHHIHRFRAVGKNTLMEDTVRYALPLGPLGRLVHWLQVRRDVEGIFRHRERRIRDLFGMQ